MSADGVVRWGPARPRAGGRSDARATHRPVTGYDVAVACLLALACWSSYAPPTIDGLLAGALGIWTYEPLRGSSIVIIALIAVVAVWSLGALAGPVRASRFDASVLWLLSGFAGVHLLAVTRGGDGLLYELLDLRALLLMAGGYFVMSRVTLSTRDLLVLLGALAMLLTAHATWLTLRYGVAGDTGFATSSGRIALLITEDTLLLAIPVTFAWGLLSDGLLRRRGVMAVILLLVAVLLVELFSLRRGALIFIGLLVAVRSCWAPPARVFAWGALAATVAALAVVTGPLASLTSDVSYAVRSTLLLTDDSSSSQRLSELEAFRSNSKSPGDVFFGHGLGAVWYASAEAPTDVVSFGGDETALVRVGWHIYGLDFAYKVGLLGILGLMALFVHGALATRERVGRIYDPLARSVTRSLGLIVPVLTLFVFTNPRISLFAGLCLGALSALLDRAPAPRAGLRA